MKKQATESETLKGSDLIRMLEAEKLDRIAAMLLRRIIERSDRVEIKPDSQYGLWLTLEEIA